MPKIFLPIVLFCFALLIPQFSYSQTEVTLNLTTDCWGGEVSWGIYSGNTMIDGISSGNLGNQTEYIITNSLDDGCFELRIGDTYGDGLNGSAYGSCGLDGNYTLTDEFGNILAIMGDPDYDYEAIHVFCLPYEAPEGCTDASACNYNPFAGNDNGTCEYITCAGCIDDLACNFNEEATLSDDSCEYISCAGCTDTQASNYDETATISDDSCTYPSLLAVITQDAGSFCPGVSIGFSGSNSEGNTQTFSWDVAGPESFTALGPDVNFTFNTAGSYNVTLTVSDGTLFNSTAESIDISEGTSLLITIVPDNYPQEISYTLVNSSGEIVDELLLNTLPSGTFTKTICLSEECHSFNMSDSYGDGLLGSAYYSLTLNGIEVINSSDYGSGEVTPINCPTGTSCFEALIANEGINTAPYDNSWFVFTPATSGQYNISTCETATCNTVIWVYDYCQGLPWNDTNEAAIYYNDDDENCGVQSNVNPLFEEGFNYYIRIGDSNDDCDGLVDFEVSFVGEITGCMDINACNFEPLATLSNGDCYFNDDAECTDLGPDLWVLQDVLQSSTYLTTLSNIQPNDCYIQEGCIAGTGDRDIVRFTTHIKNIGTQDYFIGQPSASPDQFEFDPCHGHYHYEGYAEYVLYDNGGVEYPEIGFKNGFCVLDLECSDGGVAKYGCNNMGITAGCGDIYSSGLACQWVDVTTVPVGTYTLVVRTNWDQSPDANGRYELRYDNNWAQVCFSFDRNGAGDIIDFQVLPEETCTVPEDCLGQPFGTTQPDCNGNCPGLVVKGDANASLEIEAADAQIYVSEILGNDAVVTPCSDMDSDGLISVSDAALLSRCAIYGTNYIDEIGVHNHCEWISEVINENQTTTLSIGEINTDQGYVDVFVLNPDNRIVGYEFEVSGLSILSTENLYTNEYTITPSSSLGGNKVIGLSYSDESIAKNLAPTPLVRLYYTSLSESEVCVSNIIDIVNVEYHNTLTSIGACMPVIQGDFAEFVGGPTTVCQGSSVTFNDLSVGDISTWEWSFSGGTPASSSEQNPSITYNLPGIYDVTLTVGNGLELDSETKTGYITVTESNVYYSDGDSDGYGDPDDFILDCAESAPVGYVSDNTDCAPLNGDINPGVSEVCNGFDDNCDGSIDEGLTYTFYFLDSDNDGFGNDLTGIESCNGAPSSYSELGGDCDDADETRYPGAPGTHEGIDNNCDGEILGDEVFSCAGDVNGDLVINISDLSGLLSNFGCVSDCVADFNFDGQVSSADLSVFLQAFGTDCF